MNVELNRRMVFSPRGGPTDTSTYDASVTDVSDVDALVMMPVAMIMTLITRRLQPNHGNCAHTGRQYTPS